MWHWVYVFAMGFFLWIAVEQQASQSFTPAPVSAPNDSIWPYVDDQLCRLCHEEIFDSYQDVGMARSFSRPKNSRIVEDFSADGFYHERTRSYLKIENRDSQWFYQHYQKDERGQRINFYEREIDWVLGSGNKSRTYLYQTGNGQMYQFPLAWYSDTKSWAMAPGFAAERGADIFREVKRECMFCHNAYPTKKEPDRNWNFDRFPRELPEGIGCQRCHGPGKVHIGKVLSGGHPDSILSSIINPARLSPGRRDDVCNQCHLQPSIAAIGIRNYERGDYSYVPGQRLGDYQIHIDVELDGMDQQDRFEINHHAYRLYQSQCYQASRGELGCTNCHDPHRKVLPRDRENHFRAVCLQCHAVHDQKPVSKYYSQVPLDQCITCHMPQHRSQDVVEVVVTDHLIRRQPPEEDWQAPLEEKNYEFGGVRFLNQDYRPDHPSSGIYLAAPVIRVLPGNTSALDYLEQKLATSDDLGIGPYYDLLFGQINQGRYEKAMSTSERILAVHPESEEALISRGVAEFHLQGPEVALRTFKRAVATSPNNASAHYDLGLAYQALAGGSDTLESESDNLENYQHALAAFTKALLLRDNFTGAALHKAQCQEALQLFAEAEVTYLATLAMQPKYTQAYTGLASLYVRQNHPDLARRYLQHGLRVADDPEQIQRTANALSIPIE